MAARRSLGVALGLCVAALGIASAHGAHALLDGAREQTRADEPFAPSSTSAPFLSLGYREAASDLLFVRLIGYFGGGEATAHGVAELAEAIATLDPKRYGVYEFGARAIEMARFGVDNAAMLRAIALLDAGQREFPTDWRLPYVEGMIYAQDLQTTDRAERRRFDEEGTRLVESAIRKPHAPAELATWASVMRTKLGQHERAVTGLREMLLVSSDESARRRILARLGDLEDANAEAIANELLQARQQFERRWKSERPALPATMYLLLGPHRPTRFELGDLATGGRDVFGARDEIEVLPMPE